MVGCVFFIFFLQFYFICLERQLLFHSEKWVLAAHYIQAVFGFDYEKGWPFSEVYRNESLLYHTKLEQILMIGHLKKCLTQAKDKHLQIRGAEKWKMSNRNMS